MLLLLALSIHSIFSRDEATLYEGVSVRPSVRRMVGRSVTSFFYGPLGATNAVYTALFFSLSLSLSWQFFLNFRQQAGFGIDAGANATAPRAPGASEEEKNQDIENFES